MKDFLALVAKKGVVLEEKDFLALITYSDDHSDDEEDYEFYASPDLVIKNLMMVLRVYMEVFGIIKVLAFY